MISSLQSSSTDRSALVARPGVPGGAGPEARLLALMVQNQLVQGESAKTMVNLNQEQLTELRETVRQALEAARQADEDSGFWGDIGDVFGGDIATIAEVVGVAAASIGTGGAAALIVGAISVACTLAAKYADELGIPKSVALGIGIAAAVMTVASGNLAASSNTVASLSAASSNAVTVGGEVTQVSRFVQIAQDVKFATQVAKPAATAVGAGAYMASGYYRSDAVDHNANAQGARNSQELVRINMDQAIDLLSKAIDAQLGALAEGAQTLAANQQSKQLIIQSFQGMA